MEKDFFGFLTRVLADRQITHASFRLLTTLAMKARVDGFLWYTIEDLGSCVGFSERSVRLALGRLESVGVLCKQVVGTGQLLPNGKVTRKPRIVYQVQWQYGLAGPGSQIRVTDPVQPTEADHSAADPGSQCRSDPDHSAAPLQEKNIGKDQEKTRMLANDLFYKSIQKPFETVAQVDTTVSQCMQRVKDLSQPALGDMPVIPPHTTSAKDRRITTSVACTVKSNIVPVAIPPQYLSADAVQRIQLDVSRWSGYCSDLNATPFSMAELARIIERARAIKMTFPRNLSNFFTCLMQYGCAIVKIQNGLIVEIFDHSRMCVSEWLGKMNRK